MQHAQTLLTILGSIINIIFLLLYFFKGVYVTFLWLTLYGLW